MNDGLTKKLFNKHPKKAQHWFNTVLEAYASIIDEEIQCMTKL